MSTAEQERLKAHRERLANWKLWGPYLSERAWGTVREDYGQTGEAWEHFPHDHARSRVYRWNEDGIAGISDRNQYLCFAVALWNGNDSILKERMFGLTNREGNHGEDVKEYYFYLDNTPTHSYMKMLYKYPHDVFPYGDLVRENIRRGYDAYEYELLDTGVFENNRYVDVQVEYAKADEADLLIQITVTNRGRNSASCTVLPTLWFRNTWCWGYPAGPMGDVPERPRLTALEGNQPAIAATHSAAGNYWLYAANASDLLFTDNETNRVRLEGLPMATPYAKDGFHRYLINGEEEAINPAKQGTKSAALYRLTLEGGASQTIRLRLANQQHEAPFAEFDTILTQRVNEADEFYAALHNPRAGEDERRVQRQAWAGMLWSKQLYYYDVHQWRHGDPEPTGPHDDARQHPRNDDWEHLHNFDIISMPDKWEYPWYAAWDLAFHCLPLAEIDPDFAKRQLILLTREWYIHPNGQLPGYEWNFGDVNPPLHAWAAWHVYQLDAKTA